MSTAKKPIRYGCLMLAGNIDDWNEQIKLINSDDIVPHPHKDNAPGIEDEPHITALYGFHEENDIDYIKQVIREFTRKPITVELTGISHFSNDEFDVIKFDVNSEILHQMNAALRYYCPYTSNHPEYHPHLTLGYVKKGLGTKYDKVFDEPINLTMGKMVYSDASKNKTVWNIIDPTGKLPTFEEFLQNY